jgi:hypothetical protein
MINKVNGWDHFGQPCWAVRGLCASILWNCLQEIRGPCQAITVPTDAQVQRASTLPRSLFARAATLRP